MNTFPETSCSILSFEEPDLLRSASKPGVEMTLESVKEDTKAVKDLIKGAPYYLLFISDTTATYTKEAREYMDNDLEQLKKAEALVVNSLGHRIIANFYTRTRRRHHPIRVFATDLEAREWINSLREREVK